MRQIMCLNEKFCRRRRPRRLPTPTINGNRWPGWASQSGARSARASWIKLALILAALGPPLAGLEIINGLEVGESINQMIQEELATSGNNNNNSNTANETTNGPAGWPKEANRSIQAIGLSQTGHNMEKLITVVGPNASELAAEPEQDPLITRIILTNTVIFVIGLCGNAIVIVVILKFTRIETVTDIYILNLAFADLMFTFGLVFLTATMIIGHWIFGRLMCKLYMATTSLNQFASSLLLVVMSFDRYLAVCHPIYAQRFRRLRRAKIICLCIWICCLILMTPMFAFADTNSELTCAIVWPEYNSFNCEIAFTMYSLAIGFAVPFLLIAAFYSCVIRKLRLAATGPMSLGSARRSKSRETTNRRVEHLVIGIICTYTICWLPYWIMQLCVSFHNLEHTPIEGFYSFVLIATCLSYTNSALNPILYAFLSDNFKRRCTDVVRSIYSLKWCQHSHCTEPHSTTIIATAPILTGTCESESARAQRLALHEAVRLVNCKTGGPSQANLEPTKKRGRRFGPKSLFRPKTPRLPGLAVSARNDAHRKLFNDNNNFDARTINSNQNSASHDDEGGGKQIIMSNNLNSPEAITDSIQGKKSVAFGVETVVVQQSNNNGTVMGNHMIVQADRDQCHGL